MCSHMTDSEEKGMCNSKVGEDNGSPLQCSCLENPRDSGTWWAAVYGVAQSRTELKQLSSSSSNSKVECVTPKCYSYSWGKCSHSLMENVWKTFIFLHQAGLNTLPLCFHDKWSHSTYQMKLSTSVSFSISVCALQGTVCFLNFVTQSIMPGI